MTEMKGGELIVEFLVKEKVPYVFGICGHGNVGILDAQRREVVLDRLMALEAEEISLDDVKWVVLMVRFSQPGQEVAFARMEDLVFEEDAGAVH